MSPGKFPPFYSRCVHKMFILLSLLLPYCLITKMAPGICHGLRILTGAAGEEKI